MGKKGLLVLSIITALLAITAAVFSYLLFDRRNEFRGRADKLATGVAGMVTKLDNESGSNVKTSVNFTPADPASKSPEKGTLGWQAYHEAKGEDKSYSGFQTTVNKAVDLAGKVTERRNHLAESLGALAQDMRMSEEDLDVGHLKGVVDADQFGKTNEHILQLSKATVTRDDIMISTYVGCGNAIGFPLQDAMFRERDESMDDDGNVTLGDFRCADGLAEFTLKLTNLHTRCGEYADTLRDAVKRVTKYQWETDTAQLTDETRYSGVLTSMLNDFDGINEQLVLYGKTKLQLAESKLKIEELIDEQDLLKEELLQARGKIKELLEKIRGGRGGGGGRNKIKPGPDNDVELPPDIEGHIVQVNSEWNFVVIDLGWEKGLRDQTQMLIARGNSLVARVMVSKVLRKICVAEILPEIQTADIVVGDRVILPNAEPETASLRK